VGGHARDGLARPLHRSKKKEVSMAASHKQDVPKLHESYTTYVYWGFALVFIILLVVGFVAY
jgi:hypothetical protein